MIYVQSVTINYMVNDNDNKHTIQCIAAPEILTKLINKHKDLALNAVLDAALVKIKMDDDNAISR